MALWVSFFSYLNLLGTGGFVVVSPVIALQLSVCKKASGVDQWVYKID